MRASVGEQRIDSMSRVTGAPPGRRDGGTRVPLVGDNLPATMNADRPA